MLDVAAPQNPIRINKASVLTYVQRLTWNPPNSGHSAVQGQLTAIRDPDLLGSSFEVLLGRAEREGLRDC